MQDRFIYTTDDVLRMLDALLADRGGGWWDEFYADRARPVPFFTEWPDENLAAWFGDGDSGLLPSPFSALPPGLCRPRRQGTEARRQLRPGVLPARRRERLHRDQQVYERAGLGGGLGYSEDRLRALWDRAPFALRVLRQMNKGNGRGPCFGEAFLWALLATKDGAA